MNAMDACAYSYCHCKRVVIPDSHGMAYTVTVDYRVQTQTRDSYIYILDDYLVFLFTWLFI